MVTAGGLSFDHGAANDRPFHLNNVIDGDHHHEHDDNPALDLAPRR